MIVPEFRIGNKICKKCHKTGMCKSLCIYVENSQNFIIIDESCPYYLEHLYVSGIVIDEKAKENYNA